MLVNHGLQLHVRNINSSYLFTNRILGLQIHDQKATIALTAAIGTATILLADDDDGTRTHVAVSFCLRGMLWARVR